MKPIHLALIILSLLWGCSKTHTGKEAQVNPGVDSSNSHYSYEPNISTLSGTIKQEVFWGPPNYGEDTAVDQKEQHFILHLGKSISVEGGTSDSYNFPRKDVKKIQLISSGDLGDFIGKQARVTGKLFGAHTGHHHTEVLLLLDSIR